jgi:hypothetical protein
MPPLPRISAFDEDLRRWVMFQLLSRAIIWTLGSVGMIAYCAWETWFRG